MVVSSCEVENVSDATLHPKIPPAREENEARTKEAKRVVEDNVNELRELIRKLRKRLD